MSKNVFTRHWRDVSGAFADVGVLFPIAVSLIVLNGLSATFVLLPAALLYLYVAWGYRVPVAVQPLKAFGALAIATGAGPSVIASGALLLGVVFVLASVTGVVDRISAWIPRPVVRGVQLSVGLLLLKVAAGLVISPPEFFIHSTLEPWLAVALATGVVVMSVVLRTRGVALLWILLSLAVVVWSAPAISVWGPSALSLPTVTVSSLTLAAVVLVLPQAPLTFANACVASSQVTSQYFGHEARRVTPGRLARSLGVANIAAGLTSGMPVCHGAGGVTAHYSFGARSWRAPFTIGVVLLVAALLLGRELASLCAALPVPVLAGMIATTAVMHVLLLRDLSSTRDWLLALAVGVAGFAGYLAAALIAGSLLHLLYCRNRPSESNQRFYPGK